MRRRTTTTLALSAAAGIAAPLAFAASTPDYRTLIVKSGKKSVQATLGSRCIPTSDGKGDCTEVPTPLKTSGTVTVSRGGQLTLLFAAPVGDVRWQTSRVNGTGQEIATAQGVGKLVTKTKKRWRVTLPKNLKRSSKIFGVLAQSPNAYASFEVALKVR